MNDMIESAAGEVSELQALRARTDRAHATMMAQLDALLADIHSINAKLREERAWLLEESRK